MTVLPLSWDCAGHAAAGLFDLLTYTARCNCVELCNWGVVCNVDAADPSCLRVAVTHCQAVTVRQGLHLSLPMRVLELCCVFSGRVIDVVGE